MLDLRSAELVTSFTASVSIRELAQFFGANVVITNQVYDNEWLDAQIGYIDLPDNRIWFLEEQMRDDGLDYAYFTSFRVADVVERLAVLLSDMTEKYNQLNYDSLLLDSVMRLEKERLNK